MVRGHAKEVAQQKNAAKQAAMKKSGTQKNEGVNKMKGTKICPICKAQMPGYAQLQEHYSNKHPKDTCPPAD